MAVRIETRAEPIPGYKLIERIGGGGFGEVWKCEAPGGLLKAIKFVFGDLEEAGQDGVRAEQELKALSRVKTVRHPYILSLERYDIIDGQLIIVMELADRNLWDRYKECRHQGLSGMPRNELLDYMEETAEALDLMNIEYQLQHLDIKPQNLFLVHNHIKVADFGLVKDLEGWVASVTGGVTPVYAAPETFEGWVSRYSDQYSLAIVYQELLTGHRPFTGNNIRHLVVQHLQGVPDLSALSEADRGPVGRALAKKPDARFATCLELIRALRDARVETPPSRPGVYWEGRPGENGTAAPAAAPLPAAPAPEGVGGASTPPSYDVPETHWIGVQKEGVQPLPIPAPSVRVAPTEVLGNGVLLPAFVLGVGRLGLDVLRHLRENLCDRFGSMENLPHLRTLYVDTDPEVLRVAARGNVCSAFSASEILLTRLNRPSHYFRPKDGKTNDPRVPIESWFDPKMLYRIPRRLVTNGVRALGRLALCDNYRTVAARLRAELDACTQPESLAKAAETTELGLRTNRPRVYVVANLGGGTGGGMFLDLAYLIRALLRELGHARPQVVGLLLLPSADTETARARAVALGNAYAALRELTHYASPGTEFTAFYDEKERPIRDAGPPFDRCLILPLPREASEEANRTTTALAAEFLRRDLTTPLGRAVDQGRANLPISDVPSQGQVFQTFGMYTLSCPRRQVVRLTARMLCQQVVQRWLTKDSAPIRSAVRELVKEHLEHNEVQPGVLIERLQQACAEALQRPPETVFAELLDVPEVKGATIDPRAAGQILRKLDEILGRPGENPNDREQHVLPEALKEAVGLAVAEWGHKLSELVVQLVEKPGFRLAGAEEAIRQMVVALDQVLQHHDSLNKELGTKAFDTLKRLHTVLAGLQKAPPQGKKLQGAIAEAQGLLRDYPKCRYQNLVLQHLALTYISLRGLLSDQLREAHYCRARLTELHKAFGDPKTGLPDEDRSRLGKYLLPTGCKTLRDAANDFLKLVSPEDLRGLDDRMQTVLRQKFEALLNVCLSSTNLTGNVVPALQREAEAFVSSRWADRNAAELFIEQYTEADALTEITAAANKAIPTLVGSDSGSSDEVFLLATPPGEGGDRFLDLARRTMAPLHPDTCASGDEILLYRECTRIKPAELDLLGPIGRQAYEQLTALPHFTPHTRTDVVFPEEWGSKVSG